ITVYIIQGDILLAGISPRRFLRAQTGIDQIFQIRPINLPQSTISPYTKDIIRRSTLPDETGIKNVERIRLYHL
ncbi:hypothetical protein, partial [Salmonella enterica]|uniref:hypothetical protein n=1 Tax=Salmonella enterica TaxID=28901 RepID=UPI0032E4EAAB